MRIVEPFLDVCNFFRKLPYLLERDNIRVQRISSVTWNIYGESVNI